MLTQREQAVFRLQLAFLQLAAVLVLLGGEARLAQELAELRVEDAVLALEMPDLVLGYLLHALLTFSSPWRGVTEAKPSQRTGRRLREHFDGVFLRDTIPKAEWFGVARPRQVTSMWQLAACPRYSPPFPAEVSRQRRRAGRFGPPGQPIPTKRAELAIPDPAPETRAPPAEPSQREAWTVHLPAHGHRSGVL